MQMKIKFMYENNCLLVIFCGWIESQKLKTQKLKCYVLGLKSQKFPTAENTRYTVIWRKSLFLWYSFTFTVVITHEIITFQAICMDKIPKDFKSIKDTYYAALT